MDFIDWRKSPEKTNSVSNVPKAAKYRSKPYVDYVEEQIREAMQRGEFDNLPGAGKPLKLDENVYAGEKAVGYNLLKSNGFAPTEVELSKEIRDERAQIDAKLARIVHRSKTLHRRRVPPFASEKRAFNAAAEKAAAEYAQALRSLNRKILNLNLLAPSPMHQPMLNVEQLVQEFREKCPLFIDTQQ